MSCDIHCILERRVGDKWVAWDTFQGHTSDYRKVTDPVGGYSRPVTTGQNYKRFAALAGVRGYGPAPRGLPEDISETTRAHVAKWGIDGHSHSWLPMAEAAKIYAATEYWRKDEQVADSWGKKFPTSFFFNIDTSQGSDNKAEDFRLVFWFDN
jgi:hypothetical protein